MGSANPGPISYEFSTPVIDLDASTAEPAGNTPCPTTVMAYTQRKLDGSVFAQSAFDSQCQGGVLVWNNFATSGGPITQCVLTAPAPMATDFSAGRAIEITFEFNMPCPVTDDSMLDRLTVRRRLNQEWNTSKTEGNERGGWILYNDATDQDSVWFDASATIRNLCHDGFSRVPPGIPGFRPMRMWHTHIVHEGIKVGSLGPDCADLPPEAPVHNGPGADDRAMTEAGDKPHVVIDDDQIWIQYPMGMGGATLAWGWVDNCRATV